MLFVILAYKSVLAQSVHLFIQNFMFLARNTFPFCHPLLLNRSNHKLLFYDLSFCSGATGKNEKARRWFARPELLKL